MVGAMLYILFIIKNIGVFFKMLKGVKRVEEHVRSESENYLKDIIIFGKIHYDNLDSLIQKSDVLKLDSSSKGGKRKTKRKIKLNKRKKSSINRY